VILKKLIVIALMMVAASISETSVNFYQAITQKTAIFILAALRTSNFTKLMVD
jgi:hypothetical protein